MKSNVFTAFHEVEQMKHSVIDLVDELSIAQNRFGRLNIPVDYQFIATKSNHLMKRILSYFKVELQAKNLSIK